MSTSHTRLLCMIDANADGFLMGPTGVASVDVMPPLSRCRSHCNASFRKKTMKSPPEGLMIPEIAAIFWFFFMCESL